MRRYDIVSRILLILSIIDFALAAPVLVQEKRQARVDVVQTPRGMITVLQKRGAEELEKLAGVYLKTLGKPVDSSEAHGSTNVVQAPAPNPASSTTNPDLLIEPLSPSSTASSAQGVQGDAPSEGKWWHDTNDELDEPMYHTPPSTNHGSDHELEDPPPPGQTHGYRVGHVQPNLGPSDPGTSNPRPSTDSDFDWDYWTNLEDTPRPAASPKEPVQVHTPSDFLTVLDLPWKAWVWPWASKDAKPNFGPHMQQPNRGPFESNTTPLKIGSPKEPDNGEVALEPPPSPDLTDPKLDLHHLLSTDLEPADFKAAIYAAKGKTKESRHVSSTARDVGNAAPDGVAA